MISYALVYWGVYNQVRLFVAEVTPEPVGTGFNYRLHVSTHASPQGYKPPAGGIRCRYLPLCIPIRDDVQEKR